MTAVFRGVANEFVLAEPGLYLVSRDGVAGDGVAGDGACCRTEHLSAAAGVLVVHLLGDFIACSRSGRAVLVNNRVPLGRLQRLQEGDVIEIRQESAHGGKAGSCLRLVYGRKAPPIQFVLPASSPIRCGYTLNPLAGQSAVRCGQCFRLYCARAWAGELGASCPHCGWPHEEVSL